MYLIYRILLCSTLLLLVKTQQNTLNDVFLNFDTDSVIDDTTITIGIGRPVQTYRLRVVFSPLLFNTSDAMGHITLYNSDRLRLSSATYEHVIPGRLGRDIVEIGSVRWLALIDTRPTAWHDVGLTGFGSISYTPDGLIFLGDIESPAPGDYWQAAHIDRLGVTWTRDARELPQHRQAGRIKTQRLTYQEGALMDTRLQSVGSIHPVQVPGYGGPLRIHIAPDSHITLVPKVLFQWYITGKNLYNDAPIQWPSLVFTCPDGLLIQLKGAAILPLRDDQFVDPKATDINRVMRLLVTALEEKDSALTTMDNLETIAGSGFNTLKMMPHTFDNETVILGGHLLWSSLALEIEYGQDGQAQPIFRVSHHAAGTELSGFECFLIFVAVLLYIRWKLGALFVDYIVGGNGYIRFYYFVISADSIVWPFLLPLWASLLIFYHHWSAARLVIPTRLVTTIQYTFLISWSFALVFSLLILLFQWRELRQRWAKLWEQLKTQGNVYLLKWFQRLTATKTAEEEEPPEVPYLSEQPRHLDHWIDIPDYAVSNRSNKGEFFWTPALFLLMRDSFLTVASGLALWFILGAVKTPIFAMIFTLAILLVVSYTCVHHFFTFTYLLLWPALSRHRPKRFWPPVSFWFIWLLFLGITVDLFYLTIHIVLQPFIAVTSAVYGNSDDAVQAIVLLFIGVTLFIMSQFSYSYLTSLFIRRGQRSKSTV